VYSRAFESLIYVTLLFSAYLLNKCDFKLRNILRVILLISVFISVYSYLNQPVESNWELTKEEFRGLSFAGENIPNYSYVFSDFRLGTPLIYFNQQGIITIDGLHNLPNVTDDILCRCYYNVSKPEIILDSVIASDSYFVMISSHQTEVNVIDTSLTRFKKASLDFEEKWSQEKSFSKIYSSKSFELFARNIR